MVAIAFPQPTTRPRRLQVVPDMPSGRPGAGVGRSPLVVALLAAVVVLAVAYLAVTGPSATDVGNRVADTSATHVVAEGETMWSIATDLAPAGEAATYAERLVEANGGGTVEAGQVLTVPAP